MRVCVIRREKAVIMFGVSSLFGFTTFLKNFKTQIQEIAQLTRSVVRSWDEGRERKIVKGERVRGETGGWEGRERKVGMRKYLR